MSEEEPNNVAGEEESNDVSREEGPAEVPVVMATLVQPSIPPGASPSVTGQGGYWMEFIDIDMCRQGDAEIVHDWMRSTTIEDLKRTVEEKGYSAITVSNGHPSFGHAALKKFDFQLTHMHCKPISSCCKHPCKIYIYTSSSAPGSGGRAPALEAGEPSIDGDYFSFKTGGDPAAVVDRFRAQRSGNRVTYYRNQRHPGHGAQPGSIACESYTISGDVLTGPVSATVQANGDIVYSHGYTSRRLRVLPHGDAVYSSEGSGPSVTGRGGRWMAYTDIDMCGQGDTEIIPDWRSHTTLEDLKRTVELKGYSAITVSNGHPSFGHAALKKFPYQLTKEHCKPISTCCRHPCKIYIYDSTGASPLKDDVCIGSAAGACDPGTDYVSFKTGGDPGSIVDRFRAVRAGDTLTFYRNQPSPGPCAQPGTIACESYTIRGDRLSGAVSATVQPNGDITWSHGYTSRPRASTEAALRHGATASVTGRSGYWMEFQDIDMCRQGDVSIIQNWRSVTSIEAMKRTVEENGYSAITVSNGNPSFLHAAIKKFDFQLKPEYCKPISSCCRHPCKIYIYFPTPGRGVSAPVERDEIHIDGDYFSFKTGGDPAAVVDRFRAKRSGNRVTYYRNQRHPGHGAQPGSIACESYTISGDVLTGPVSATVQANGDIVYSHGYTSRRIHGGGGLAADDIAVVVGTPVPVPMQDNVILEPLPPGIISAEDMAGCWTCACIPLGCACFEKRAVGHDRLVHKGLAFCCFVLPCHFVEPRVRVPGTNGFYKEDEGPSSRNIDTYHSSGCVCNGLACSMKLCPLC